MPYTERKYLGREASLATPLEPFHAVLGLVLGLMASVRGTLLPSSPRGAGFRGGRRARVR